MISSNKAEALFQKRDYQKIFLEDAKKAQKRGNESAAFHLYERAMFYYPKNENIIKSYAEFCESRQYYDKAKDLYIKLFIMTKANKYLFKRYLCEIKDNKYPNSKLQKYSDNKLLNEGQKRLLNVEMIKQFAYEQDWENTKKACDKILKKDMYKNIIYQCIAACKKSGDKKSELEYYKRVHELRPKNVNIIKKILELAEELNDIKTQMDFAKKFSEVNPKDKGIKYRLAGVYMKYGEYKKAEQVYEELIKSGDKSDYVKQSYAFSLEKQNPQPQSSKGYKAYKKVITKEDLFYKALKKKNYPKALSYLEELLKKDPNNKKMIGLRADIALEQKDYPTAIIFLEKFYNLDPKDSIPTDEQLKALAYYYSQVKDYPKSLQIIEDMLQKKPNDVDLLALAVQYSMVQEDWDKSLAYTEKILEIEPSSEKFLKMQGDIHSINQDFQMATKSYEKLVESYPKDEYKITLANLYQANKDFEAAQKIVEPIYKANPNDKDIVQTYLNILLAQEKIQQAYVVIKRHHLEDTKEGYRIQGDIALENKNYASAEFFYSNALSLDYENESLKNKLGSSYRGQKKFAQAEQVYDEVLSKDIKNIDAQMGLAYLELDKKNLKKSRKMFKQIARENPDYKDAKMGVAYTYSANGDRLKSLGELNKIPPDNNVNYNKASLYYDMEMYSNAQNLLKGAIDKNAEELKYKLKKDRAVTITPNYGFLFQQLAAEFQLNYNKVGFNASKYVGKNMKVFGDYNLYVYSSGTLNNNTYNNVTNEFRGGTQGRFNEKNEIRLDLGTKVFQDAGAMINTDSWIKHYFNDSFNLKLGFKRDNLIQSYLSAVGVPIDNVFTGQVADNKVYVEAEGKHPKQFYSFGRYGFGSMMGQNIVNNPYMEGMLGIGRVVYNNPENKWVNIVNLDAVTYNAGYKYNLLNIYSDTGVLYGGYYSPEYFSANTLNAKIRGDINKKLKYRLEGFAGGQASKRPSFGAFTWGAGAYLSYDINEHLNFNVGYNFYNYADVQRHLALFNLVIKEFKNGKKIK